MSRIILVHGAWHGGWCWDELTPLLQNAGHDVYAPDLPGHGNSPVPINKISLKRYVQSIDKLLTSSDEPAILVGHSMGGMVISQLAEQRPEQINRLVYLCAFLPQNGEALAEINSSGDSLFNQSKRVAEDGLSMSIDPLHIREIFYHDCDPQLAAQAQARLVDQAIAPLTYPVQLSAERFGSVRKNGVVCLQDQALTPELQRKMYAAGNCDRQFQLDSSHSPFYSMPEQVAEILLS